MSLNRIVIGIIIAFCVCIGVFPRGKSEQPGTGSEQTESDSDSERVELRLDYYRTQFFLENMITRFNFEHKDIRINGKKYESVAPETQERRLTELLAGNGPDLLAEYHHARVLNNYKSITSGVYHNVDNLFANDERLKDMRFFDAVLNAGVFDSKRYYIPYTFEAVGFYTTPELLKKYNIEINDVHWTWEEIASLADRHEESLRDAGIYMFNFPLEAAFISSAARYFVDYEKRESTFSSKQGIEIMQLFKELYSSIRPFEMDNGLRKNNLAYLLDERTVFSAGVSVLPAVKLASAYTGLLGEGLGLRVFPLPLPGSEKRYQFSVTNTIGIYGGSEHKEEAFEFIVYMLQDDVIGNPNLNLMVGGIPVNKTAYELLFKNMQKKPKIGTRLPEELVADSMQILNNLAWSSLYDRQIEGIVKKYMAMYFSGEMTSAAAARAIDENVNLYLSE